MSRSQVPGLCVPFGIVVRSNCPQSETGTLGEMSPGGQSHSGARAQLPTLLEDSGTSVSILRAHLAHTIHPSHRSYTSGISILLSVTTVIIITPGTVAAGKLPARAISAHGSRKQSPDLRTRHDLTHHRHH